MPYVWEIACGYSTGLMNEEQGQGRVWGVRRLRHGCHTTEPTLGSTTRFPAILASIANPKAPIDLRPTPLEVPKEQSIRVFGTKPRFDVADPAPAPGSQVMGTVFARPCSSLSFSDSVRTVQGWTTLFPNLPPYQCQLLMRDKPPMPGRAAGWQTSHLLGSQSVKFLFCFVF